MKIDCKIFSVTSKGTKIYQEGFEDGRLEGLRQAVPRLLELGLTIEQVAEGLGLTIEQVQYAKLFYEGFQEGQRIARVKLIPMLLELGVAVEQVAEAFGLSVEEVEQVTQNQSSEGCGNFNTSL
ncbi:hypothetical protein H1Q63_14070 [Desmonostoc muscorum CCALA 125]|nr:hypothetical protein [Desmonostoc muscorum CCALA 125]